MRAFRYKRAGLLARVMESREVPLSREEMENRTDPNRLPSELLTQAEIDEFAGAIRRKSTDELERIICASALGDYGCGLNQMRDVVDKCIAVEKTVSVVFESHELNRGALDRLDSRSWDGQKKIEACNECARMMLVLVDISARYANDRDYSESRWPRVNFALERRGCMELRGKREKKRIFLNHIIAASEETRAASLVKIVSFRARGRFSEIPAIDFEVNLLDRLLRILRHELAVLEHH